MRNFALKRRVLIVGEGRETEFNYFVGFRNAFGDQLDATATSVSVARGRGGDARGIVENAIKEVKKFQPNRRLGDRVFLLLDTEGPGSVPGRSRAPELPAAERLATRNGIEIVYSCPSFEYWLLCHFQKIPRRQFKNCDAVIVELNKNKRWSSVCNTNYDKGDHDIFERLSPLLDVARGQSLEIDMHHIRMKGTAHGTNPSTQVYELIAFLIGVIGGERCPIAGTWKLIGNPNVTVQIAKGSAIQTHSNNPANWQLA